MKRKTKKMHVFAFLELTSIADDEVEDFVVQLPGNWVK